jgi:asparagine synthase (glutamine-hydrolysing)
MIYGVICKDRPARRDDLLGMEEQAARFPRADLPATGSPDQTTFVRGPVAWGPCWRCGKRYLQWDGEIYNSRELEMDLQPLAVDPLLVLYGWQRAGRAFLERLNGPFALALWDMEQHRCFLARGRQGLGALFWSETAEGWAFARDLDTLFQCAWVPRVPDWTRLPEYMVFDHVAGGRTLYRDVRELLPGQTLVVDPTAARSHLVDPTFAPVPSHLRSRNREILAGTDQRLHSAAARLWTPDRPGRSGLFLSGGVDSALLAEKLTSLGADQRPPTLTVTCPTYRHDEAPFARTIRRELDLPGEEIVFEPETFAHAWREGVLSLRYPQTSTNQAPWWLLCHEAHRRGWGTVFSGEGADGWIGGGLYEEERAEILRLWDHDPEAVADRVIFCRTHCLNDPELVGRLLAIPFDVENRRMLWDRVGERDDQPAAEDCVVLYHVRTTGQRLLTRADQAAAAFGIRLRLPYLEADWLHWIRGLPFGVRNAHGVKKWLLKQLCADRWGEEFAFRKKIGFPFPLRTWIRDARSPVLEDLRALTMDSTARRRDIYRPGALEGLVRPRLEGRIRPADWLLWSVINVELWLRDLGY